MVGVAVGIWTRSAGEFRRLHWLPRPAGLSFLGNANARLAMDDADHCLRERPLASAGPYQFLSHPNDAVVAVEIAVLVLGLPHMAAVFPILNAAVLANRTGD
jgi:hypothetical protein